MSALTSKRFAQDKTIRSFMLPLKAGATAYTGGACVADLANAYVLPAAAAGGATVISIGQFEADVDNSAGSGTAKVNVKLSKEIDPNWYDNVTGSGAVAASNLFQTCYFADDHTVTMTSGSNTRAGRVWGVSVTDGVLVQNIDL